MYNLFLDDIRTPEMVYSKTIVFQHIVRSYDEFVRCITDNGLPSFASFDNDLGEDENHSLLPDGYACAKWLVYESGIDISDFNFKVHSANPVAKQQIISLLDNYKKHLCAEKAAKSF